MSRHGGVARMRYFESILDTIGNTPLVKLPKIMADARCLVLAKLEMMNPGGSVKDRIGEKMIEDAEAKGLLKPGGTIIEPTSGNTGLGLAMVAAIKGYRAVFTMPDKMSREKIDLLKALGARVVVTPTAVPPEHPDSYYRVAERIHRDTRSEEHTSELQSLITISYAVFCLKKKKISNGTMLQSPCSQPTRSCSSRKRT